ncbi:MAG: hypothetical protein ACRDD1_09050 [Planctomycetia bacterium]
MRVYIPEKQKWKSNSIDFSCERISPTSPAVAGAAREPERRCRRLTNVMQRRP